MATIPDQINILAVTRKPASASFEQRVLNHIEPLSERGVAVSWREIPVSLSAQRRLFEEANRYAGIWWHRHTLSGWTRHCLRSVRCPIVFDFDDPLGLSSRRGGRPSLTRSRRFAAMLRRADAAFAASAHLRQMGLAYCANTTVVPMAVDLPAALPDREPSKQPIELLWIGQRSTQVYLESIRGVLEALGRQGQGVRLRLVAHEPMSFGTLAVDFRRWTPAQQQAALRECDIGLCPMPDTPWTRGKCPYKVLQYMAHAMAWVGSAVGENVVAAVGGDQESVCGVCAADEEQWLAAIQKLAGDAQLRHRVGHHGHRYVMAKHHRLAIADQLASAWRGITNT